MASTTYPSCTGNVVSERLEVLFEELAELAGQRNAIDARIVEIAAEMEHDGLWGSTGARSVAALVAWKLGSSSTTAHTITTVAGRLQEFPQCAAGMREGRLSLDQVGVIAAGAGQGSDAHYAELARNASVNQLRTAVKLEPRPDPDRPGTAALDHQNHRRPVDLLADQTRRARRRHVRRRAAVPPRRVDRRLETRPRHPARRRRGARHPVRRRRCPPPWTRSPVWSRPAGTPTSPPARTGSAPPSWCTSTSTARIAALHLGPLLADDDRRYLTCDATCEVWFERHGQVIGAGRETRLINRRLRRALEHRDRCCVVPGCGATRGLHAHHIQHWEDGGPTDLANLVLVCPYHHRLHHRGVITITGPAHNLVITDSAGRPLSDGSLARPPTTPPPAVAPSPGPSGERADWWWYQPFQPQPPPTTN